MNAGSVMGRDMNAIKKSTKASLVVRKEVWK
jgi:hypothetical protein